MAPSVLRLLSVLSVLLLLLPCAAQAQVQAHWKTGEKAPTDAGSQCIYLYQCVKADGTYAPVYAGQATDCRNRLRQHAKEFADFNELMQRVSLRDKAGLEAGSVLEVLEVEQRLFGHEACILKKCMEGAAQRAAAIAQAQAPANAVLDAAQQAALQPFDPAKMMMLEYLAIDVSQDATRLNAAESWLVAKIGGEKPSKNSEVCNRKIGGKADITPWEPDDQKWTTLEETKQLTLVPDIKAMRTVHFDSMLAKAEASEQLTNTNADQVAEIAKLRAQVHRLTQLLPPAVKAAYQRERRDTNTEDDAAAVMIEHRFRARAAAAREALQPSPVEV